jgi:hypothetical protein
MKLEYELVITLCIRNQNQTYNLRIAKIAEMDHKFFRREHELINERLKHETVFSYIFQHPSDVDQELFLTILAFNIPNV